jgi:hypothetical protein
MAKLGYAVTDASLGSAFTRSAFLTTVGKDYAVYVHSHDDNLSYAHVVSAKAPPRLAVVLCRRQATPGQLRGAGEPKSDRPASRAVGHPLSAPDATTPRRVRRPVAAYCRAAKMSNRFLTNRCRTAPRGTVIERQ